jgi:hypothetical protein
VKQKSQKLVPAFRGSEREGERQIKQQKDVENDIMGAFS